jgi:hypothetical protein
MAVLPKTVPVEGIRMSLISGTNFVAPLRSKAQIVGIFALAVLVAVVRLTGSQHSGNGGAASGDPAYRSPSSAKSVVAPDDVDAYLASRRHSKVQKDPVASGDITVDKLLKGEDSEGSSRPVFREDDREGVQPEKLNDIKRSLGLN